MQLIKQIMVTVTLAALLLPCGHAAAHFGHHHDIDIELCVVETGHCACHACEPEPCTDRADVQLSRASETTVIDRPSIPEAVRIRPAEKKVPQNRIIPPVPGVLASLQTVQLLI